MKALESRKFIVVAIILAASIVWMAIGKMDAGQWIGLAQWIASAYILGNVGEKAITKWSP